MNDLFNYIGTMPPDTLLVVLFIVSIILYELYRHSKWGY